jgi:hypothetical protein
MLLFETSAIGWKFMITRFVTDIFGIMVIAYITERFLSELDKKEIYENALKEIK